MESVSFDTVLFKRAFIERAFFQLGYSTLQAEVGVLGVVGAHRPRGSVRASACSTVSCCGRGVRGLGRSGAAGRWVWLLHIQLEN